MGSQSLWQSAKSKLDRVDQELLAFDDQDRLDILERLGETTREAYDPCVRKRWHINVPGKRGEKIIICDLLSWIVHWVQVFKDVGDQAIQYDPGHVALPWLGARFLLQVSSGWKGTERSWLVSSFLTYCIDCHQRLQ